MQLLKRSDRGSIGGEEYGKLGCPWEHLRSVTFDKLEFAPFPVTMLLILSQVARFVAGAMYLMHLAIPVHMHLKGFSQEEKKVGNKSLSHQTQAILKYIQVAVCCLCYKIEHLIM